jgi:hypothetical protein
VLSERDLYEHEMFTMSLKTNMKITSWDFGIIMNDLEWRFQNKEKSTITDHVLWIFEIFIGGKGTLDRKYKKIHLLNILPTRQSR